MPLSPRLSPKADPASEKPKKKKLKQAPAVDSPVKETANEGAAEADARKGEVPVKSLEEISKVTRKALKDRGIANLFEVQHRCFGPIFSGKDTVGRAKTGCGKTLAFCLPVVERIIADSLSSGTRGRKPLMVGLAPTRELAKQIFNELTSITKAHNLSATCLYGGTAFGPQCDEIRAGLDMVIATPGRLLDHLKRGTLSLESVKFVVLDEADEMLSMGFQEDVEAILSYVPAAAQKLLFSATMPKWVQKLISEQLRKDHVKIDVVGEGAENQANSQITHQCIPCSFLQRGDTLADLCKVHAGAFGKTLVFTDTKKECDELAQHTTLVQMGAGVLHGDIPQKSREVTMENFRTGKIRLLLATDVAARGLDVPNVDLVVQTHPPLDLDTYVHRAGRTARAGRTGTCTTFYGYNEEYLIRRLKDKKGIPIKRIGPPQPCDIVAQAARDSVRQIDHIHQDNVDAFSKVAEELLAERGSAVFLLSAALAAMTGYTARIKSRSLLSSNEGSVAVLLESERELEAQSKAWYLLRQHVSWEVSQAAKGMRLCKGKMSAIFDVPQDHLAAVLNAETWKGVKFSQAKELPDLEPLPNELGNDAQAHKQAQAKRWDRIRGRKDAERQERQDRHDAGGSKGGRGKGGGKGGKGLKRKFDEIEASGEAASSSGRGGGGRGSGKGRGRGRG